MPKGVPNKRHTGEFKRMVVETMMRDKLSYFSYGKESLLRYFEQLADRSIVVTGIS